MDKVIDSNILSLSKAIATQFNIDYKLLFKLYKSNKKKIIKNDNKEIKFKELTCNIYKDNQGNKYILLVPIKKNEYYAFKIIRDEI